MDNPTPDNGRPIVSLRVDHYVEFADQAVTDPAELAALKIERPRKPIFVDTVDHLVEFTDPPVQ